MSKLRTNTIENLDNTSSINISDVEIKQESYINLGEYGTISIPVNYNNTVTVDGVVYRLNTSTIAPYTLNGDWAVDGPKFVSVGGDMLRQELSAADGSNLVGYQAQSSTSVRTVQEKLREVPVSVVDFGAVGDGIADDTAAIQAAATASKRVYFQAGTYKITSPILFGNNQAFIGESKGGLLGTTKIVAHGSFSAFQSEAKGTAARFHPTFQNLTINNVTTGVGGGGVGSAGIDLTDVSLAKVEMCSFRYHEKNIVFGGAFAGYYNTISDCEISSAAYGLWFGLSGNSNRVIGGRVHSNTIGIYGDRATDIFLTCAIESNETGIDLLSGCSGWTSFCRFEGNGRTISGDVLLTTLNGAVVLRPGSRGNHIFGFCSGGGDRIIDQGDNFVHLRTTGFSGVAPYASVNKFTNPSLSADSNGDGLADGLTLSAALPAGSTMAIDTAVFTTGDSSQRYRVSAAGSSRRDIYLGTFATTPGLRYVVALRVRTNLASGWSLRGSASSFSGTDYASIPLSVEDEWVTLTSEFVATSATAYLYLYTPTSTVAGGFTSDPTLWIDSVFFGQGSKAPEFGETVVPSSFSGSATYDPTSLAAGAIATTTVTCTGAALGDYVQASFSNNLQGVALFAWVSSANTVSVQFRNNTAAAVDLASGTLRVLATR